MSYYNTCGAHLDPCEVCDCKQNAAPVLAHKDGGEQIDKPVSNTIVSQEAANLQAFEKEFYGRCRSMSNQEAELLDMIRSSKDPAEAARIAIEVILEALK